MNVPPPTVLVICEGFGYTTKTHNSALAQAETPFLDALCEKYPTTLLKAHGNALGYPDYYGSSPSAGFWTLISGEKNSTQLAQLDDAIQSGTFFEHKVLEKTLTSVAKHNRRFHIIITLSFSSPENRIEHLLAIIHAALFHGVKEIMIHIVLTNNNTFDAKTFTLLEKLETTISAITQIKLASIQGVSYSNARTATKTSIEESYAVLTQPSTTSFRSWKEVLSHYYILGTHDGDIPPTALFSDSYIHPKDTVMFATYNTHECSALKEYITQKKIPFYPILSFFDDKDKKTTSLYHQKTFKDASTHPMTKQNISTLAIIEYHHKNNLCVYAENNFKNFIQNINMRTVIQAGSNNAHHTNNITEAFIEALNFENHSLYILNYSNAAQQALKHNLQGAIEAIENIDSQLGHIHHEVIEKRKGKLFITSSYALLEDIQFSTKGSTFIENNNPVFFIAADSTEIYQQSKLPLFELIDIIPFVLKQTISHNYLKE